MSETISKQPASLSKGLLTTWPLTILLICLGFALQLRGELNCDDSWFITFAEHVLNGATPYVDISDPNLPAAFLIYMPAVILGKISGLRIEALVVIEAALVLAANLALMLAILNAAGRSNATTKFTNAALFAFLILPGAMYAEREHFAAMFALPIIATYYVRSAGSLVRPIFAICAGLAASCVLAIKPHFGLALALPGFAMLLRQRQLALIFRPETIVAIGLFIVYLGLIVLYMPAYFTVTMPEILEVYARGRNGVPDIIDKPATLFLVFLYAAFLLIRYRLGKDGLADCFIRASSGFFVAYLIQGKMSPNHGMPAIAMAIMALLTLMIARSSLNPARSERLKLWLIAPTLAAAPLFTLAQIDIMQIEPYPGLKAAVMRVAPAHPKIAAITEIIDVPFPIVRQIDGTWIGRQNSLWRVNTTDFLIATTRPDAQQKARYQAIADRDRTELAADIAAGRPDIILVENADVRQRQLEHASFAHALDDYHRIAMASSVEIWMRAKTSALQPAPEARSMMR